VLRVSFTRQLANSDCCRAEAYLSLCFSLLRHMLLKATPSDDSKAWFCVTPPALSRDAGARAGRYRVDSDATLFRVVCVRAASTGVSPQTRVSVQ
jgi:hypothetical protein